MISTEALLRVTAAIDIHSMVFRRMISFWMLPHLDMTAWSVHNRFYSTKLGSLFMTRR